ASATSATVENNEGFAADTYVIYGAFGQEQTEIVKLTSVTGNTTIGHSTGPVFAHPKRTPVIEIKYNQIKVYRSATETGVYSLITTVDITPDDNFTYYDDTSGTTTSWYKVAYYNETTANSSGYSAVLEGVGYTVDSLRALTDEVLSDFGDPLAVEISRTQVRRWLRAGVRKLATNLVILVPDYRRQYTTQALTSGTATYDLPTRFLEFIRIDINYTGSSATDAKKVEYFESEAVGQPDTAYTTEAPRVFIRADQFGLRPTPTSSSGYAFLWYWDYPADMTGETDVHGLPYGASEYLVSYALYRAWIAKDRDKAAMYKSELREIFDNYITFISTSRQGYQNKQVGVGFGADLYSED
ncbi:MAG: hypothetical protein NUV65_05785, partial [Candidatus Roizmanbacteria bacterium]|nr:hypothetical protein [Candidatus Roizmanbacteria bacterium]